MSCGKVGTAASFTAATVGSLWSQREQGILATRPVGYNKPDTTGVGFAGGTQEV